MAEHDSRRDWPTLVVALAGVLLGVTSLLLTVSWHRQALKDSVLVRLDVGLSTAKNGGGYSPDGTVQIVVVNTGMRPLYLQQVLLKYGGSIFTVPMLPGESTRPLAPGQPAKFAMPWNLAKYPFRGPKRDDVWVQVKTSRTSFDIPESQTGFFEGLVLHIVIHPAKRKAGQQTGSAAQSSFVAGGH